MLTGGTGFVGSHVLYWLVRSQTPVVALVDDDDGDIQIRQAIERAGSAYYDNLAPSLVDANLSVVIGQRARPDSGVSPTTRSALRGTIDEVWHITGCLNEEPVDGPEIKQASEDSIRHVLELASTLGCRSFVYVSAASEKVAEQVVVRESERLGLAWRILRASTAVGPYATKRPGGARGGLYAFVRELQALKSSLQQSNEPVTVAADPDTRLDFLPVDELVSSLIKLRLSDFSAGPIRYLTNPDSLRLAEFLALMCDAVGVQPFRIAPSCNPRTQLEWILKDRLDFYLQYFRVSKDARHSLPISTGVSVTDLRQFIELAVADSSGNVIEAVLRRELIRLRDGTSLATFAGGRADAAPIVLVNAFGVAMEFLVPMARSLARTHRVLTWECRGAPSFGGTLTHANAGLTSHADDLHEILAYHGISQKVHLVGWCSGTHVVHRFARLHGDRVASICLLNGPFHLEDARTTAYQSNMKRIMPRLAKGPAYAQFYVDTLCGSQVSAAVDHLFGSADPVLLQMLRLPFRSSESAHRYGIVMTEFFKDNEEQYAGAVDKPSLIVGGRKDRMAHYEGSEVFARHCRRAKLLIMDDGDHYSLFSDASLTESLRSFVLAAENGYTLGA